MAHGNDLAIIRRHKSRLLHAKWWLLQLEPWIAPRDVSFKRKRHNTVLALFIEANNLFERT